MKVGDRVEVKEEAIGKSCRKFDGGKGTIMGVRQGTLRQGTHCSVKLDSGSLYAYDMIELILLPSYVPITHEGKVYMQLKEITGEKVYEAQGDKKSECFRKGFSLFVSIFGWMCVVPITEKRIEGWSNTYTQWLPWLKQHGFIRIEKVEPELKACPFCGGKPKTWWDISEPHEEGYNIECCYIHVCKIFKDEATEAWNSRD